MQSFHKLLFFSILLCFSTGLAWATHIRAGDLSIERTCSDASLEYIITVTLYRDTKGVDPYEGRVSAGDGTVYTVPINSRTFLGNETERVVYVLRHTYRAPGNYRISFFQQNRNPDIKNVASPSDSYPFYIDGEFLINPILGCNRSPKLLLPPIDRGCVGRKFLHNPAAYDEDGDSLSYRLVASRVASDRAVPGFGIPAANQREDGRRPGEFFINAKTGDLTWDAPVEKGQYNVAFFVDEWRNGIKISSVNRDMQIIIVDCNNQRPRLVVPRDTCVVAGAQINAVISATDPDTRQSGISLSAGGGVFVLKQPSRAANFVSRGQGSANFEAADFSWQTTCNDVQHEPYQVVFKATDRPLVPETPLVDFATWRIKVVGPKPENLTLTQDNINITVTLNWSPYACANAVRMTIWRRVGPYSFNPVCESGLPAAAQYQKIGEVPIGTTSFIDRSVRRGTNYCYRIYAEYPQPKGGEGLASAEVCAFFPSVSPYMTHVDVAETDSVDGKIIVRWTQPPNLDTLLYPKPITYRLARALGFAGQNSYVSFGQIFSQKDTVFTDTNLNTRDLVYNYRVTMLSQGNVVDSSIEASSVRLTTQGDRSLGIRLRWAAQVPWSNITAEYPTHYIYRSDLNTQTNFKLIDSVRVIDQGLVYLDSGQFEGKRPSEQDRYCYYVSAFGSYGALSRVQSPLINRSQISCGIVPDTTLPCPPVLSILKIDCQALGLEGYGQCGIPTDCSGIRFENQTFWTAQPLDYCKNDDVVGYRLYVSKDSTQGFTLLRELPDTSFLHQNLSSLSHCYYVTAIDDFGNESQPSNIVCNHDCEAYPLPNIFTPNGDGSNEVFRPCQCTNFVSDVSIKIFGRWGNLVYEYQGNPEIRWSGDGLAPSTYYYHVKVNFISGRSQTLKGWVTIGN
jgi:gliding motility-associated-like protein